MPIDPNIALGVRQPEPINMLGQMGQMMALRAAQQQYESENALRDFYAQGGDTSTPEGQRKLRSMAPKLASDILQKEMQTRNLQSEISSRDLKAGADSLKMLKENIGVVNNPQDMVTFLQNSANTPGGKMLFSVVPLDKAIANIPTDPKAFQEYKRNFGLTSDKLFESADAQLKSRTDYGVAGMQINAANWRHMNKPGEVQVIDNQPVNITTVNGQPVVTSMAEPLPVGTPAPSFAPTGGGYGGGGGVSAPRNAMVQPQNAPAPVNALVSQPATQQQTPAATPQKPWTIEKIPEGYRKTADGNLEYIPGGPKDPNVQAEQSTAKLDAKTLSMREAAYPDATKSVKNLNQNADTLIADLKALKEHKGLSGITGQFAGRIYNFSGDARSAQADLNKILSTGTLSVLTDLRNASKTGGALGNVSNKDVDLLTNSFGALNQTQDTKDFIKKIDDAIHKVEMAKQNANEAYDMTYEYRKKSGKTSVPSKDDPLGLR